MKYIHLLRAPWRVFAMAALFLLASGLLASPAFAVPQQEPGGIVYHDPKVLKQMREEALDLIERLQTSPRAKDDPQTELKLAYLEATASVIQGLLRDFPTGKIPSSELDNLISSTQKGLNRLPVEAEDATEEQKALSLSLLAGYQLGQCLQDPRYRCPVRIYKER